MITIKANEYTYWTRVRKQDGFWIFKTECGILMRYMYYTKKQAMELFKTYLKELG